MWVHISRQMFFHYVIVFFIAITEPLLTWFHRLFKVWNMMPDVCSCPDNTKQIQFDAKVKKDTLVACKVYSFCDKHITARWKKGRKGKTVFSNSGNIFPVLYKELLCGERARWEIHEQWKDFSMATCSCACTSSYFWYREKAVCSFMVPFALILSDKESWYEELLGTTTFHSI